MTQVITRYFENASQAFVVKRSLEIERFPRSDLEVLTDTDTAGDALTAAQVDPATVSAYAKKLAGGGAVLVARATYKPLGAAQLTRDMTAQMGAADMGDLVEEVSVKTAPGRSLSVFSDHPHYLTRRLGQMGDTVHMADWPIPLISRRKPVDAFAFPRHARMADFPMGLISRRKPKDKFAFPRHARMARFPIPLLSKRKPWDAFAFPRHARMANFPISLISRRKPFTGTVIGRHTRMANWPFPHLINGKPGTNALVPNGARMANFPISLISRRTPKDKFAFPRHARMANFPIGLTSQRKPFTGSMISRHGRMADLFLPLVIKHGAAKQAEQGQGFSLSRLLGMPTVLRR
ncbi:PucR family transcriptional regulator [uncultured Tateyamaria sp.]|uniref:PucR family transcriptional regulator n=1 Tax=uncultured Tateyamaria sp. TaxID=455651 RepID=UPI0026339F8B|nr:PucR family transcriptional regulator [uncultured Tateyamaria sp.]